jgi:hypothetical protein
VLSRLEGRVTIPASTTATVGAGTATITAGTYYPTTLLAEVATRFATASGTTCTVTGSFGRTGTGLVTIVFGVAKAIAWVSTDLRDLLGFAGDSASATSHVGTLHARNVWLPGCPYLAPNAIDATFRGYRVADMRVVESASGYVWAHMGQEKEWTWLRWTRVPRAKVWQANETTANASWERFVRDAIWGVSAWGTPGGPIRFYPDADAATYATYSVADYSAIQPEPNVEGWVGGPWRIDIPRLVVVPGT